MTDFLLHFHGVRGSYPTPGPQTNAVGGNTPCVEIRAGGHVIILDAGTGIIGLGNKMVREYMSKPAEERDRLYLTILLSHMHHDHIQGYPFFTPLYLPQTKAHVYGPRMLREDLDTVLSNAMVAPYFPVDAESLACERYIQNIKEEDVVVFEPFAVSPEPTVVHTAEVVKTHPEQVVIRAYHNLAHPRGGSFCYRVEHMGRACIYATDVEGYVGGDSRLIRFSRGADVLIHDAQYLHSEYVQGKQGWGHSSVDMAIDVATQAEVKQLVMFHHAPTNDDATVVKMERAAQEKFPGTLASREGMILEL